MGCGPVLDLPLIRSAQAGERDMGGESAPFGGMSGANQRAGDLALKGAQGGGGAQFGIKCARPGAGREQTGPVQFDLQWIGGGAFQPRQVPVDLLGPGRGGGADEA